MLYWMIIGLLAIPGQVLIIPLFVLFSRLNLTDNLITLTIFYATLTFPFGTFFMVSFYKKIPNEIIEVSEIDGANIFQIYLKIMLPLGRPAITALAVINFFAYWNELFMALIINRDPQSRIVTPFISLFNQEQRVGAELPNWPLIFDASLISIIIPLLVYLILQNKLVEGLTVGAIKG